MSELRYQVDEALIAAFESNGVVRLPAVLDQELVERARAASEWATAESAKRGWPAEQEYFYRFRLWEKNAVFNTLCTTSAVPEIAAQLLRTHKVNLFYDQLFAMQPGAAPILWHNDLPYWPLEGRQAMTVWLAFDRIVKENGALEFIRGSHLWDQRYRPTTGNPEKWVEPDPDDGFVELPDFDAERDQHELLTYDLNPGDALAFHSLVVHCAYGNSRPDMKRRGYAIRLAGADVRYVARPLTNFAANESLKTGDVLDSDQYPVVFDSATM